MLRLCFFGANFCITLNISRVLIVVDRSLVFKFGEFVLFRLKTTRKISAFTSDIFRFPFVCGRFIENAKSAFLGRFSFSYIVVSVCGSSVLKCFPCKFAHLWSQIYGKFYLKID